MPSALHIHNAFDTFLDAFVDAKAAGHTIKATPPHDHTNVYFYATGTGTEGQAAHVILTQYIKRELDAQAEEPDSPITFLMEALLEPSNHKPILEGDEWQGYIEIDRGRSDPPTVEPLSATPP